ncbi:EexN family lipoprotein [Herbaspirillum huttiense]|uniref:EexN family lipoprotein n=2 Tax=Herbaspirillum huttiense TaxID=863372 RepID=A0AAJ2H4T8_9BURK|nr:EexN family lipoprotein [Herbaspirillum huttiense]MDR9836737.1 EexN family lipoprotein [Herbaspirillum huttiense]
MKKIIPLLLAVVLTACGPAETPEQADIPTVDTLASDPARLKELRQQCKTDRAKLGDELCNRVAEATNRRFLGDGKAPYTPPKEQPKF